MKLEIGLIVLAFLGGMTFQSAGKDQPVQEQDWGDNPMENPEFIAAMMKSAAPGEPHREIAKAAGKWDVEMTMYAPEGGDGTPSKAQVESEMVLGGRYLLERFTSEYMGMPMEGMLLLGYDNLAKEYVSIWMDTWSTWPSIARGDRGEDGKVVQVGTMYDLLTPDGRPYRHVSWEEGDDVLQAEMYDTLPSGEEWMVMKMTYTRKK